jgi:S1-C subfamily serine protease
MRRRPLRATFLAAACLVLTAPAATIFAQSPNFFDHTTTRGWTVQGSHTDDGSTYCSLNNYRTGSRAVFDLVAFIGEGSVFLAIENPGWNIVNDPGIVDLYFYRSNGSVYDSFRARAQRFDEHSIVIPEIDFEAFAAPFYYASSISVDMPSGLATASISLIGSGEALSVWADCVDAAPPDRAPAGQPDGPAIQSGTGFVITADGTILTNAHVVEGCKTVTVGTWGNSGDIRRDEAADLAIILPGPDWPHTGTIVPIPFAQTPPRLGDSVLVFGFPLSQILAESLNVTQGIVSSLMGPGNDSRYLQTSASVNLGNSGGPLLNDQGRVVGVVTARLDDRAILEATGTVPAGVAFALRREVVLAFLTAQGIRLPPSPAAAGSMTTAEIAAQVAESVLPLSCSADGTDAASAPRK